MPKTTISKVSCIQCFGRDGLEGLIGERKAMQFNTLTARYDEFTKRCFALCEGSIDLGGIEDYISGQQEVDDDENDCFREANPDEIALLTEILKLAKKHKFDEIR